MNNVIWLRAYVDFRAKADAEKYSDAVDRAIAALEKRRRDLEWYRKGRPQNVVSLPGVQS